MFSPIDGLYVSYQRLVDLKVTRTSNGDHWFTDSQTKCERFENAIYEPDELRCKCPHEFPHFFSESGEQYGCYADSQIDDSKDLLLYSTFGDFACFSLNNDYIPSE